MLLLQTIMVIIINEVIFMNILRQHIEQKKKLCGTVVTLTDPCICELFGYAGFDFVWIDTEHSYMSYKDVLCHINGAKSANICSLVRVPQNDLTATKKILEMGPDGIIFPMVRSTEEMNALIDMTLYPPHGTRGFGPLRAIGYRPERSRDYVQKESLSLVRLVQIESIALIDALEEAAAHPFVDGFIFGPNDLSGSLGEMLNVFGEKTVQAIRRAAEIIKRHGKKIGLACGSRPEEIEFWKAIGLDMLFAGGDWSFLSAKASEVLALLG